MNKKENLTANIKIRVNSIEKETLSNTAKQNDISISELIRQALFSEDASSSIAIAIQGNMLKHQLRNKILAMGLSQKQSDELIKKLTNND